MAKLKLGISNVKDNDTTFGSFAKGYRQSNNVIDRRASQYRPTETQEVRRSIQTTSDGKISVGGSTDLTDPRRVDNTPDDYSSARGAADYGPALKSGQTRKVEPQQAIDETFNRR